MPTPSRAALDSARRTLKMYARSAVDQSEWWPSNTSGGIAGPSASLNCLPDRISLVGREPTPRLRDTLHAKVFPPLASCKHLTYPPSPNLPSLVNRKQLMSWGLSDFRSCPTIMSWRLSLAQKKCPHRRDDGNHSSKLPIRLGVETMHIAAPNRDHSSTPNSGGTIDGRQCSIQDNIHQDKFLLK